MRSDTAATGWIFTFFLCLYLLTAGGHYGGDGFWAYLTAESIVLDGDLTIGDRPFLIKEMVNQYSASPEEGVVAASGRRYSMYGLGMVLVEIPFYATGYLLARAFPGVPEDYITMFTVSMTNVFLSAIWCVVFFSLVRRFGYKRSTCLWITGIFGMGSFVFPYALYGFSEPLLGLAFLGAVAALYSYRQNGSYFSLVCAGVLSGFAVFTKIYAVIALPLFALYIWPEISSRPPKHQTRAWVSWIIPLIFFGMLTAGYNWVRYDSMFETGYHLVDFTKIGGFFHIAPFQVGIGLYGLLLSSGRGVFFFLPVTLLAPIAFRRFWISFRMETLLFTTLIGEHILFYACYGNWHGGSSWGPRFLLPVLPFLILPLGSLMEGQRIRAFFVKALGLAGFLVQLPAALVNYHLFVRFVQDQRIGDLMGLPGQPGDPLFSPNLSPIVGGYYQVVSGVFRLFTGQSLTYPVASAAEGGLASLASCDLIDIWSVNVIRTGFLGPLATIGIAGAVFLLIFLMVVSAKKLIRWSQITR